jgi:putative transposase
LGLTAGPVPTRVDAGIKGGLLALVDHAVAHGWSTRRACALLEVNDRRVSVWRQRRTAGLALADAPPGPAEALHGLLDWERQAILELFDEWAEIDRSHRKLAHRGSRLDKVFVSESSVLRVLQAENLILPAAPARDAAGPRRPWPEWVEYRPCQVWAHDFSAFAVPAVTRSPSWIWCHASGSRPCWCPAAGASRSMCRRSTPERSNSRGCSKRSRLA